jgi:hypothetical protein
VLETFINYVDKFGPEMLVILTGMVVILSTLFLWLWFSNRRKYHNLKHAIPANVVKSYLDSIIQNSTALKSSLFRGGGIDVSAIPSVMPLGSLVGGEGIAVSGAPSTALLEELNQRKAQLAALEAQIGALQGSNKELDTRFSQAQGNLTTAEKRVKELEAMLASGNGANDETLKQELAATMKERDDIRDRLREFEIIADDLANLKRLQQENEQLKRSLAAAGASIPAAPAAPAEVPAPAPKASAAEMQADVTELFEDLAQNSPATEADTSALEDFLSAPDTSSEQPAAPPEAAASEAQAAAPADEAATEDKTKNDRTPEDLLSEFEKMLG